MGIFVFDIKWCFLFYLNICWTWIYVKIASEKKVVCIQGKCDVDNIINGYHQCATCYDERTKGICCKVCGVCMLKIQQISIYALACICLLTAWLYHEFKCTHTYTHTGIARTIESNIVWIAKKQKKNKKTTTNNCTSMQSIRAACALIYSRQMCAQRNIVKTQTSSTITAKIRKDYCWTNNCEERKQYE